MASRNLVEEEKGSHRFLSSLSSAVSEWILILLLFLNGFFSYSVMKFARRCKLQVPCLFCSRFDHVLVGVSPHFHDNLICTSHKLEISSLAYCHIHRKLADVREICEPCLLSFATEKKSNSETYRSVVGKLEINSNEDTTPPKLPEVVEGGGPQFLFQGEAKVPLLNNANAFGLLKRKNCSCCAKPFRMRSHAQRLLKTKSVAADLAEPDISVLALTSRDRSLSQHGSTEGKEVFTTASAVCRGGHYGSDQLSHIGYTELKITSDSESEVPISDDDDGNAPVQLVNITEEILPGCMQPVLPLVDAFTLSKTSSDNIAREKVILAVPVVPDTLIGVQEVHVRKNEQFDSPLSSLDVAKPYGGEELNWGEVESSAHPEQVDTSPHQISAEEPKPKDITDIAEVACMPSTAIEVSEALSSTEICIKPILSSNTDSTVPVPTVMDLNEVYKLVIVSKGNELSPKGSFRVQEDLKMLLSQISRGLDSPRNDMTPSPRMRILTREDSRLSDASGTSGQPNLSKRLSIERNESGFESSFDGSVFGDNDGENVIDKLKRHVELDRKSLSLLYKELEEERSAASIAANQALAMITRLQEEKAAMQMEALQYQRMMEEQAEYDQEALQRANDLLAEREKEVQDLEAEIASYRRPFDSECDSDEILVPINGKSQENNQIRTLHSKRFVSGKKSPRTNSFLLYTDRDETTILGDNFLDFEEEKMYISECLKKLESKLHLLTSNGIGSNAYGHSETKDGLAINGNNLGRLPQMEANESNDVETPIFHKDEDAKMDEDASSFQKDTRHLRETSSSNATHTSRLLSVMDNRKNSSESPSLDHQTQEPSAFCEETDIVAIVNEVSHLNDRLKSLEADRYFIDSVISSLQNGEEWSKLVQEIATNLRELRKIGISRKKPVD